MVDIFSYLGAADLDSASQTSKLWRDYASDQHVLMNAFLRKYGSSTVPGAPTPVGGRGIGLARSDGSSHPGQPWKKMYSARRQLEKNWQAGRAQTNYLFGHTDSVYCVQFDE